MKPGKENKGNTTSSDLSRADFLKLMAGFAAGVLTSGSPAPAMGSPGRVFDNPGEKESGETCFDLAGITGDTGMPLRFLGRTKELVSLLGLGGFHISLGSHTDDSAVNLMRSAIDEGITLFENSREYNGGLAERRMGKALRGGYRDRVFLLTKNCGHKRTGLDSMKSLEESLRALKTDTIDLWMFHEVIYDNDPEWIVERGGLAAALRAKAQGKIRYIGFSGHKRPEIHLDLMGRHDAWDAVMMPVNAFDAHFRSFQAGALPKALEIGAGVIGMKSLCGFMSDMLYKTGIPASDLVRFAMSLPVSSLVMGIETSEQLASNLTIAKNFKPMSVSERAALLERVGPFAGDGRFERYKTTADLDGDKGKEAHGFK